MKKTFCGIVLFFVVLAFCQAEGMVEKAAAGNEKSDMSYAFGMLLAAEFADYGMEFNYSSLIKGFREAMENQDTRFTMDEAIIKAQDAYEAAVEKQSNLNRQKELVFLAENGQKSGVITTESGLQYEVLVEGAGDEPLISDFVRVNYHGALIDGTIFDSSFERGEPEEFPLRDVIPGFSEGILLMKEGGKSRLYIPSNLAYGSRSIGNIPPYSTLVFEVEFLEIIEAPQDYWDWEDDDYDWDYDDDYWY